MAADVSGDIFFVPHGGGPLPLMGDPGHAGVTAMMRGIGPALADCTAAIVVTAHWEAPQVSFSGGAHPDLVFDYYGFPPETYDYTYPAPGAPDLARTVAAHLADAGIDSDLDAERGYDHGTFVPMMLMRPDADLPILQMSLLASLDPAGHIAVGKALAPVLDAGVALIGSGLSFHNLRALLRGESVPEGDDVAFDDWLNETLSGPDLDGATREQRMTDWEAAPGARSCHPREEHLLPLHVCFGAAQAAGRETATNIFRDDLMGYRTSGFRWPAATKAAP
ncbi:MAG: class III extradiol ring-cleavage dioxygenase [Rhodospirillales bacterium]